MELETSRAIIISTPLVFCSLILAPICGRARPMTKKAKASEKSTVLTQGLTPDTEGIRAATDSGEPNFAILLRLSARATP